MGIVASRTCDEGNAAVYHLGGKGEAGLMLTVGKGGGLARGSYCDQGVDALGDLKFDEMTEGGEVDLPIAKGGYQCGGGPPKLPTPTEIST